VSALNAVLEFLTATNVQKLDLSAQSAKQANLDTHHSTMEYSTNACLNVLMMLTLKDYNSVSKQVTPFFFFLFFISATHILAFGSPLKIKYRS
jgi:hypothetical protein